MSREYPCVYYDNEKCTLHGSDPENIDWCVMGPCSHETPSNADHIRSMTDEELAQFLTYFDRCECCTFEHRCTDKCIGGVKKWLKQPYKEETHGKA